MNKAQIITTIKTEATDLFSRLGIKVKTECEEVKDEAPYILKINPLKEDEMGLIIGWHGESLLAIQHLLRLILKRKLGEVIPLVLDIGDYRAKQEEMLQKIATEAASRVVRTGKPVILKPMPAFERRIIHLIVKSKEGIKSESIGEGEARRIMISAEKVD
jgi:spoIIIJ-associated protein